MGVLFERAVVVGVGLIGGSLAAAARRAGLIGEVVGLGRTRANLETALAHELIDRIAAEPAEVGPVDLAVLALPVRSTEPAARRLLPYLAPGTVVTDVGSVKGTVVAELEALLPPDRPFVGSHPIAGSDRTGAAAADADLFRGSVCVLTPTPRTDATALAKIEALWRGVGARVERMSPEEHDRALAWTSHVVHVLAYALAGAIDAADAGSFALAGPSLREATRVAASSTELWRDILLANADAVQTSLAAFAERLDQFRGALSTRDERRLTELLEAGRGGRARLEGSR